MSERIKSKEKILGSGATVKGKWPYYDAMNFDVITSFSAVYIWSWTTAHRDPRTVTRGP